MTIASGNRHSLAFVAEVTYGTIPSSPVWTDVRHTACTIGLTKETVESEEIRADRQITCFRHGNRAVGGSVEGELSYSSYDTLLEAALCGTWSADVLKAGTTRRSFTFERKFADITQYLRYTGCEVNSVSISCAPNSMVGISVDIIGQDMEAPAQTTVSGFSYSAAITTCQFDSFNATLTEGGSPIALITALEMTIENGLEAQYVIGDDETQRPTIGKSRVSGSATVYFEDQAMLNKFANETESSIVLLLTDPDGNTLQFSIPELKYTSGQPDVSGTGSVSLSMSFQAMYNTAAASNIVITRNPI